jgi:hypothetical protein
MIENGTLGKNNTKYNSAANPRENAIGIPNANKIKNVDNNNPASMKYLSLIG